MSKYEDMGYMDLENQNARYDDEFSSEPYYNYSYYEQSPKRRRQNSRKKRNEDHYVEPYDRGINYDKYDYDRKIKRSPYRGNRYYADRHYRDYRSNSD